MPLKVLLVHNRYQLPGGEDIAFNSEGDILRQRGLEVITYTDDNRVLTNRLPLKSAIETIWSSRTYRILRKLIRGTCPDVVHFHNTFLRISPSAYYACKAEKVPVIQTLHNYRLLCPSANFFRNNQICELCLGKKVPLPGIRYACYRNSRSQTAVITTMLAVHNWIKTYLETVHTYITPTNFSRQKFIEGGFPESKIIVKPHFLFPDPGIKTRLGEYALFVGRLSPEKGISCLLESWEKIINIPLHIIGDGPMASDVAKHAENYPNIKWLGALSRDQVLDHMKNAKILVFPSICYEVFGFVIIEAFSVGVPVIASNVGSMMSMVENNRNGLHFKIGDATDLARCVDWAFGHPDEITQMGLIARQDYVNKYNGDANSKMLIQIYENTIVNNKALE